MEDKGPSTSGTSTTEYKNWSLGSLQSKAREVGVRFKGLSKEQLIEALEGVRLQDDAEEGSSQQMEERLQPEVNTQKSQWVVWYEEELALLGEEATIDYKKEAIHRAQEREREAIHRAEEREREAIHRAEEREALHRAEEREAIHRAEEREREAIHRAEDRAQEMALLERQITLEAARSSRQMVTPAPTMRELPRVSRKDFKPFNEAAGDIEGFFQDFEHQCRLMEVPERERVRHLVGLLEGGAAAAYRAMDPQANCEYAEIKRTILEHYAVTPDTYRTQFRTLACDEEVSFKMYAHRLKQICHRWLEAEEALTWEAFFQVILKEQFYFKCPAEIREWVRERRPATVEEAAALADEALTIKPQWRVLLEDGERPTSSTTPVAPCSSVPIVPRSSKPPPHADTRVKVPPVASTAFSGIRRGEEVAERRCYGCGHLGHLQASCPASSWRSRPQTPTAPSGGSRPPGSLTPRPRGRLGWSETQHRCYRCGQPGHLQASCPAVQMRIDPVPSRIINYVQPSAMEDDVSPLREDWPCASPTHVAPLGVYGVRPAAMTTSAHRGKHLQEVVLDGQRLIGFCDSGAFLTLADPRVVRPEAIHRGPGIVIELAGGQWRTIPTATVDLNFGFGVRRCVVGVMGGLPADVLLGNDVGELRCQFVAA